MDTVSISTCPHCGKKSKLIPLAGPTHFHKDSVFESISTSFVDDSPEPITKIETRSFWASEAINDALRGIFAAGAAVAFGYAWQQSSIAGMWAAGIAFVGIVAFPTLRILANRPAKQQHSEPGKATIQVEHVSDDKAHWILAELNPAITQANLTAVARVVVDSDFSWSMAANCKAGLTQPKHHKLKDDFVKLGYLVPLPNGANGFTVSGQGRRFFRQVALSPTP